MVAHGDALLRRYRRHYGIPEDIPLSEADLRTHLAVEMEVANALLRSDPEQRQAAFAAGYQRIYDELWWFNEAEAAPRTSVDISGWVAMIGPPCRVLEVGAGQGALAAALADAGYDVMATDISSARGAGRDQPGVAWIQSDGVHLQRDAPPGSFDAVISDQVVEHLHPDDFLTHLRGVRAVLRPGGVYAMRTPHGPSGPYDASLPFGFPQALGTHLKEYSFAERVAALREAGFSELAAEYRGRRGVVPSERYLRHLVAVERRLLPIPPAARRLLIKRLLRDGRFFSQNATIVARA